MPFPYRAVVKLFPLAPHSVGWTGCTRLHSPALGQWLDVGHTVTVWGVGLLERGQALALEANVWP